MAVYYAQILHVDSKKILTGSYSIVGDVIASDKNILKELRQAIRTVPSDVGKICSVSESSGKYTFYFRVMSSVLVCALVDNKTAAGDVEKFFNNILTAYFEKYSDHTATHYEFDDAIRLLANTCNKQSKVARSVEELEHAHNVLVENLDTLVNRGENINNLKNMADKVNLETREMSRKVSQIKRQAQIEKYKIYAIFFIVILIILYFLVF